MNCFSETTGQNRRSCSQSMHRGKKFDLLLPLEPKSHAPATTEPKDLDGHDQNLNTRTLSEAKGPLSRKIRCWGPYHLTINAQVPKLSNQNLPWQHFHIISLFPQIPKICRKLEIEETDLRLVSCLLAIQFHNKASSFLRSWCHSISIVQVGQRALAP